MSSTTETGMVKIIRHGDVPRNCFHLPCGNFNHAEPSHKCIHPFKSLFVDLQAGTALFIHSSQFTQSFRPDKASPVTNEQTESVHGAHGQVFKKVGVGATGTAELVLATAKEIRRWYQWRQNVAEMRTIENCEQADMMDHFLEGDKGAGGEHPNFTASAIATSSNDGGTDIEGSNGKNKTEKLEQQQGMSSTSTMGTTAPTSGTSNLEFRAKAVHSDSKEYEGRTNETRNARAAVTAKDEEWDVVDGDEAVESEYAFVTKSVAEIIEMG